MADYLTLPIWELSPRIALEFDLINAAALVGQPWQKQFKTQEQATERLLRFTLVHATVAQRWDAMQFYDQMQGRLGTFWVRSYKTDYLLAQAATAGATSIILEGSTEPLALAVLKRHVYIAKLGTYHRLSDPTSDGLGNTVVTITPALADDLKAKSRVQNTYLTRFNAPLGFVTDGLSADPVTTTWRVELREVQGETP